MFDLVLIIIVIFIFCFRTIVNTLVFPNIFLKQKHKKFDVNDTNHKFIKCLKYQNDISTYFCNKNYLQDENKKVIVYSHG